MTKKRPRALKEYISSVLDDIEDALKGKKGYSVRNPIKFKIAREYPQPRRGP